MFTPKFLDERADRAQAARLQDVLVACVDGLKGFPEAIEADFLQAWVQTCIVHPISNSLRFVPEKHRWRRVYNWSAA